MKVYAIHRDGELSPMHAPIIAEDATDARNAFLEDYFGYPEQLGVVLVEYAPVGEGRE